MNDSLRDSEITRRYSFVEASDAVGLVNSLDALADVHLTARVVIELKSSLDEPDWVRCSRRDEAGAGGA